MQNNVKKKKIILGAFILITLGMTAIPAQAPFSFEPDHWFQILEHDVRFSAGYSRSWIALDFYLFAATSPKIQFRINEITSDCSRFFNVYLDGSPIGWAKDSQYWGSSFTSPQISMGSLSTGMHTLKIEIYYGGYADRWELEWIKMYARSAAPIEINSVNGNSYVPPEAREETIDDSLEICVQGDFGPIYYRSYVSTRATAPAQLVYEGSGLNSYIINTRVETDNYQYHWIGRLYPYQITITLKARMTDASSGDLSAIFVESITHAASGSMDYNAVDWTLSASYGGIGARVSLDRGDTCSHGYSDSTAASGSGASGAWRTIGHAYYNWAPYWGQGFDRTLATDFEITANSIAMGDLLGHNIQFGVDIYVKLREYNSLFGVWIGPSTDETYSYILGDGEEETVNPQNYADTWMVAIPGTISLLDV